MTRIHVMLGSLAVMALLSAPRAQSPAPAPAPQGPAAARGPQLDTIKLPPGFKIEIYASNVSNAREMALSPNGTLFVGSRAAGTVYAIVDRDKDHKADEVIELAKGFMQPNGVAFRNGSLYVSDMSRMVRYDDIEKQLRNPPKPVVIYDNFPTMRQHQWHFIAFGPDGLLYVPIGSPCTGYCDPTVTETKGPPPEVYPPDKRLATIVRMKPDGSGQEIFANGVRNTVGFAWHPVTKELWFTENGRDGAGADIPPDEINRASRSGMHFGYPYCHAGTIHDPEAPADKTCDKFEPPAQILGPHVAPLGMVFYTGSMFPAEYRNQIIFAEHGSIPAQRPNQPRTGYRLALVQLDKPGRKVMKYETFAEGWLQSDANWGRPSHLLVMPDGSLLVSDDLAGAIYRISYQK